MNGTAFFNRSARLLIVAAFFLLAEIATACPNCKQAVADTKAQAFAEGFNYSIYGMISMPFLLVGVIAAVVYRAYRRGPSGEEESFDRIDMN